MALVEPSDEEERTFTLETAGLLATPHFIIASAVRSASAFVIPRRNISNFGVTSMKVVSSHHLLLLHRGSRSVRRECDFSLLYHAS